MAQDKVWRIGEINSAIKELIENSLMPVWAQAEVGTLNIHRSGHVYMTLKDQRSQLRAVFFNGASQARQMRLKAGDQVEVFGKLTVYEIRGEYQLSVRRLRPLGLGDLQRRFEELKHKLEGEGLFAPSRKKAVPLLPETIALVTSPDGAAVRDFLQIIERRFPNIHIRIYPAPVQGFGAENDLAAGIEFFNRVKRADVIVLTRGGGSMEDLWPFNEEILARAVAASEIPVISAVGHEIDFTICDFVADMRVPTPSAAAELVVGQREEFEKHLQRSEKDLRSSLQFRLQEVKSRLKLAAGSHVFREPIHLVRQKQQYIDDLVKSSIVSLERIFSEKDMRFKLVNGKLESNSHNYFRLMHSKLDGLTGKLETLGPQNVLNRGFSILRDTKTGETISKHGQPAGKELQATVKDGTIDLVVK